MCAPLEIRGQIVSPGRTRGPVFVARKLARNSPVSPSAIDNVSHLHAAIDRTKRNLTALSRTLDPESIAILEFQIELLSDAALVEPVLARISNGQATHSAWLAELDDLIGSFQAEESDLFKNRASDLVDVRDQVLSELSGTSPCEFPKGSVYVGEDIAPSEFLSHDWSSGGGIVLSRGSSAGHVAILARAKHVPMLVGIDVENLASGTECELDAERGTITLNPGQTALHPPSKLAGHSVPLNSAKIRDFDSNTELLLNLDLLETLQEVPPEKVAGIGLVRTEFLFGSLTEIPSEPIQLTIYKRILDWAGGRPVSVRTFDFGGDKPRPGKHARFAEGIGGQRGIQLALSQRDNLVTQLRALLRANTKRNLKILLPMVSSPSQIKAVKQIIHGLAIELDIDHSPPVGMMIEIPEVADKIEQFKDSDFFSLGSNDFLQYLFQLSRNDPGFSKIASPKRTEFLTYVKQLTKRCGTMGKQLSICGSAAGDPEFTEALFSAGLRRYSVAASALSSIAIRLEELASKSEVVR